MGMFSPQEHEILTSEKKYFYIMTNCEKLIVIIGVMFVSATVNQVIAFLFRNNMEYITASLWPNK